MEKSHFSSDNTDLRIGNFVDSGFRKLHPETEIVISEIPGVIKEISERGASIAIEGQKSGMYFFHTEMLAPFVLSMEWLDKCENLKKFGNGSPMMSLAHYEHVYISMKHGYRIFVSETPLFHFLFAYYSTPLKDLYYLHELQNVWHAITGEELIFNKEKRESNEIHDIPCHCPQCEKELQDAIDDPNFMKEYEKAAQKTKEEQQALMNEIVNAAKGTYGHQVRRLLPEILRKYYITRNL